MSRNMRSYLNLLIVCTFGFLAGLCFFYSKNLLAEEGASKPKLGIILPLTGKAATAGEAVKNGISMANAAEGGYFDLIFEDNALDGAVTVTAANKLIRDDKVSGLIVYASGPSNVAAPIAESASVPMIGMSVDPKVSKERSWVMIHWASNKNVADKLFDELERRKIHKVAVISSQVQGTLDLENYFLSTAPKRGIEIVFSQQILPTDLDFQTPITMMRSKRPEAIFVNLYYGQAGLFANKASKLGLKSQLFSHFIFDDDNELKSADGALDGAFFANTSCGDLSFEKEYRTKFGKRPVLGGIAAYDIATVFVQAIRNNPTSAKSAMDYIHSLKDFKGRIGIYSALPDNSFDVPTSLRSIKKGNVVQGVD